MKEKMSKSRSRVFNEDGSINDEAPGEDIDATDEIIIKRMKELEEAKESTEKEKQLFKEQNRSLMKQLNEIQDKVNASGEDLQDTEDNVSHAK